MAELAAEVYTVWKEAQGNFLEWQSALSLLWDYDSMGVSFVMTCRNACYTLCQSYHSYTAVEASIKVV